MDKNVTLKNKFNIEKELVFYIESKLEEWLSNHKSHLKDCLNNSNTVEEFLLNLAKGCSNKFNPVFINEQLILHKYSQKSNFKNRIVIDKYETTKRDETLHFSYLIPTKNGDLLENYRFGKLYKIDQENKRFIIDHEDSVKAYRFDRVYNAGVCRHGTLYKITLTPKRNKLIFSSEECPDGLPPEVYPWDKTQQGAYDVLNISENGGVLESDSTLSPNEVLETTSLVTASEEFQIPQNEINQTLKNSEEPKVRLSIGDLCELELPNGQLIQWRFEGVTTSS